MTLRINDTDSGLPVPHQNKGPSSMDLYEICKLYGCTNCARQQVSSYSGAAYTNLMEKCNGSMEYYYWKSKCFDGIRDCPNGEDENPVNRKCYNRKKSKSCLVMTPFSRL